MAKIQPSLKLKIDIMDEDNKVLKTFSVIYKELSKKQERAIGNENKEILDMFRRGQELSKMAALLENEAEAQKELGKHKDLLKTSDELKSVYKEQEELDRKFNALGGIDKFLEASKATFDLAVVGGDKEALAKFAEEESDYGEVLSALAQDAKESRGKRY